MVAGGFLKCSEQRQAGCFLPLPICMLNYVNHLLAVASYITERYEGVINRVI